MYINVFIDTNTRALENGFTYKIPKKFEGKITPGMRVLVPFGKSNKIVVAFVYKLVESITGNYEVKEVKNLLDNKRIVSDELIRLAFFMQENYLSSVYSSIRQILPPGRIKEIKEYYYLTSLNPKDELQSFLIHKKSYDEIYEKFGDVIKELNFLYKNKEIDIYYDIKRDVSIKYEEYIYLIDKNPVLKKNAIKQKAVVDFLKDNNKAKLKDVLSKTSSNLSTVKTLKSKNVIKIEKIEKKRDVFNDDIQKYEKFVLNKEQDNAFKEIINSKKGFFLLKGVTGSGKTEIFLQLVEENLKQGRESIILVPEISLTPQTIERFTGRFGKKIAVIHSKLSQSEKFDQWRMIKNNEVKIVIGARSAIFSPFENIGLIIIDEEHDMSYISGKDPKYNTIEIAELRANINKANLVLASATPLLNSMKKAHEGKYKLLELKNRINNIEMPEIEIIDMREELKNHNYSMISKKLFLLIKETLTKNEQIILFLNKTGHTSFTFCRKCGYVIKCDACDVAMTYHKHKNRLICHYCGRTKVQPVVCPNCGSSAIKEFGAGTEKLEEEVKKLFPKSKVLRMDSETAVNKNSYEKMYTFMKQGRVDILIGTQMVAKGLDFKNVTLVGIIAADISLNLDDYMAHEKTFQLITQVSGRAGRGNKKGKVVIQTYRPNHFAIQSAKNNDYDSFYNYEMNIRKSTKFPPFVDLINIRIVGENRKILMEVSKKLFKELNLNLDEVLEINKPIPAKIEMVNNRHRINILIKINRNKKIILKQIDEITKNFRKQFKEFNFIVSINSNNIN